MGERVQTQYFLIPEKKGKREPKRVNMDFCQKSSENLKPKISDKNLPEKKLIHAKYKIRLGSKSLFFLFFWTNIFIYY